MFFEIDDIKRRHSVYFDVYNVHGWIDPPENEGSFGWNYARSIMATVPALMFNEYQNLFRENYQLLRTKYEPATNLKQVGVYWKQVRAMDNFKMALGNRMQYAAMIALFDLGPRLALWRWMNAGLWKSWGTWDVEFWRRIVPTVVVAATTSWFSVPFETARAAYYADRTYPKELQKGYTSIVNALMRIPKEEGPHYLFKSAVPIMARNYVAFSFMTYLYDFTYDKLRLLEEAGEQPRGLTKNLAIGFSVFWACFASMPWDVAVRRLVEFTPKVDGRNVFDGNYRKAFSYLWYYRHMGQYFHGFSSYFWKNAPGMFATLYIADSLGLFSCWRHDYFSSRGSNSTEANYK